MDKINKPADVNVRRTFMKKIFGAFAAAVLLPKLSGLFASTKKWTSVIYPNSKNTLSSYFDAYHGEIAIGAYDFAPLNWAFCNGQEIAITSNLALFSLLGTTYGGNGTSTFMLPDLRGRFPMCSGLGQDLITGRTLGEKGGFENVNIKLTEMPAHAHNIKCNINTGNSPDPTNHYFALDPLGTAHYGIQTHTTEIVGGAGGSIAHNNLHPYLVLNFCICLNGIFPSRS